MVWTWSEFWSEFGLNLCLNLVWISLTWVSENSSRSKSRSRSRSRGPNHCDFNCELQLSTRFSTDLEVILDAISLPLCDFKSSDLTAIANRCACDLRFGHLRYSSLSFLSLFFLEFLVFWPCKDFLVFLSVFPLFSRDFRGSVGIKNPCFFGGFPCHFPKKQGKEGQG